MVDAKAVLLNQLLANANDRSWYVSFKEVVEGINDDDAFWKPDTESHSIAEIIQHLIYWNEVWQKRYIQSNFNAIQSLEDNADSFIVSKEKKFGELKDQLLDVLLQWQALITKEDTLESTVAGFPVEAEWWALIGNAATHNAYHIGQIAYIRKMKKHSYT
ncbi:DinB family protein [Geomicrobium sediminis]|uniref:Damage-inducible protein DinB n=1 Tax=Geomicrobium sediminis TaxID=1347788 RepID=A0ABS2PCB4_9BACL|nr:DinB family protein [Geomicrobium sediminis]MBM7633064.1 putative damage-inducible protein DinB [Geomicrobium sediminis]